MRTKVPTPVDSSSPASVVPGVNPLARQAAASHSSCTAMVSVMTCWRRSALAAASVLAQASALPATTPTIASSSVLSDSVSCAVSAALPDPG